MKSRSGETPGPGPGAGFAPARRPGPAGAAVLAVTAVALLLAPTTLTAHGEGVLELASSSVAAGGEIAVEGSDFETGTSYRLILVGALDEREIGDVRPDSAGAFSVSLSVPPDAEEGRYQLTAVAPDGDVVARVDLAVVGGSSVGGDGDGDDAAEPEARADDMSLERSRSSTEWAVIVLLTVVGGGAGIRLLRG